jgi:hypothetical protein
VLDTEKATESEGSIELIFENAVCLRWALPVSCETVSSLAPNLAMAWKGYDFAKALGEKSSKPVMGTTCMCSNGCWATKT